jgi:hypothetical protein
MKKNSMTFPTEIERVEISIGYAYEEYKEEDEFGIFNPMVYIEIESVEIVSGTTGIDILPFLSPKAVDIYAHAININHYEHVNA